MGGDHGPSVVVAGVALAARRSGERAVRYLLHGDEAAIGAELMRHPGARAVCEVRHTDQVIASGAKPAQALRRSKGTSLYNAIESLRAGEARAAVSAGNTGALMAVGKLILRTLPGVARPAIAASWPTMRGVSVVLDVGANVAADAHLLVDFAILGEAFHRAVYGTARPTVGLLNVGSEDIKGHEEVREAHALLRSNGLDLDYRGFVEGDSLAKGTVDVVVTDGFTGNIALKTAEGMARFFGAVLRETLTSDLQSKLGAAIAAPALRRMRARMDPSTVNGGPLLGLKGLVVKSHGGADAAGFATALRVAADLAVSNFEAEVERNMTRLSQLQSATAVAETAAAAAAAAPGPDSVEA